VHTSHICTILGFANTIGSFPQNIQGTLTITGRAEKGRQHEGHAFARHTFQESIQLGVNIPAYTVFPHGIALGAVDMGVKNTGDDSQITKIKRALFFSFAKLDDLSIPDPHPAI